MKKKIILYSILIILCISLSLFLKRYHYDRPDYGAVLGIISLISFLIIQLLFVKNRKSTIFVAIPAIIIYILILQFIHIEWPQGLFGNLSIKANYEPYNWEKAGTEKFGVSSTEIEKEIQILNNAKYIRSFLLVKEGKLVVEEYFHGANAKSTFNMKSATKVILSAAVGIALDKKLMGSVNDKIIDYFPEYKSEITDTNKFKITVKDLLTLQEGLDTKPKMSILFSLKKALVSTQFNPQTYKHFQYDGPSTTLLANLVTKTSGMTLYDFTKKEILDPLGIHIRYWAKSDDGVEVGGSELYFTARDMARFGYLYLKNGNIDGKQIIPSGWVTESTQYHHNLSPTSSCCSENGYGYLWWIGKTAGHFSYSAFGHGGQAITIIPDLDMVMVYTNFWRYGDRDRAKEVESICRIIKMFSI